MPVGYVLLKLMNKDEMHSCKIEEMNKEAVKYLDIDLEISKSKILHCRANDAYMNWVEVLENICFQAFSGKSNFEMCFQDLVFNVSTSICDEFLIVILSEITVLYNLKEQVSRKNEALAIKNADLYNKTITDGLTELYSREFMFAITEKSMQSAKRNGTDLILCIMDIDNFKRVNDEYGHLVGDEVLRKVSEVISNNLRVSDFLGRYGGEEFILLLQETQVDDAIEICERMRKQLESKKFRVKDEVFTVTISIGLAVYKNHSLEDLISVADLKMYEAKRNGKNMTVH